MPGGGLFGTSGVESGKAAPLVGGPPGMLLHTVVDGLPSGDAGDMVPVVLLPTNCVGMVPNAAPGIIAFKGIVVVGGVTVAVLPVMAVEAVVDDVAAEVAPAPADPANVDDDTGTVEPGKSVMNDAAGVADSKTGAVALPVVEAEETAGMEGVGAAMPPVADMEAIVTDGVPGVICPVGGAQVTTVPGVVGSEASGTGASVVPGAFGWVVAENGPGPFSGDVTIAPGVVGSPIAVVPIVETCARAAW